MQTAAFIYLVIHCITGDAMVSIEATAKKWGNSFGIVIPKEVVEKEKIKEGQKLNVIIIKKSDVLKKTFGTFKFKESAQKIKDELRAELYDD